MDIARPSLSLSPEVIQRLAQRTAAKDATAVAPKPVLAQQQTPVLAPLDQRPAPPAQASATPSLNLFNSASGQPLINPQTRVLHIGDSHTVGIYGQEIDKHLRSTGAKVESYGSAGSSPSWWLKGTTTRSGFYGKDETGKTDRPADWRTPRQTPKLNTLLDRFQPNVVMVSLGANLINADAKTIEREVRQIGDMVKAQGAKVVWVGPPDGRESNKPTSKQNALYQTLQRVASEYGDFIDSRPYTEYPKSGGDGVHYWGKEGTRIATEWASKVFDDIQKIEAQP
jgi:hypothetical protein